MKYYDKLGFWEEDVETAPGVSQSLIVEKAYAGDIIESRQRHNETGYQNDDLVINNQISIIADLYLNQHMGSIKYATFMGTKWKVKSLNLKYPRVIIELGGVYNGISA